MNLRHLIPTVLSTPLLAATPARYSAYLQELSALNQTRDALAAAKPK